MLKLFLFILFFTFCWSFDIKLKIDENFVESRQFGYLINLKQPFIKCFLCYRIDDIENKINGELEINNIFLFKNVPMPLHIFKNGEIIGNNKKYNDAEFRCEFKKNPILLEIIPWRENEVKLLIIKSMVFLHEISPLERFGTYQRHDRYDI
ncbi:hypothetical protein ACQ4LE_005286 [Meloidogyne hapla]|uniref:Galectin n=1 Tax=Meloidogyne hapla TaxID=6305 RepID=A0A1I8AXE5_MELHA